MNVDSVAENFRNLQSGLESLQDSISERLAHLVATRKHEATRAAIGVGTELQRVQSLLHEASALWMSIEQSIKDTLPESSCPGSVGTTCAPSVPVSVPSSPSPGADDPVQTSSEECGIHQPYRDNQLSPCSIETPPPKTRARPKRLVVTIDGEQISEELAKDTFVRVIESIGVERVRRLGLRMHGQELISLLPQRAYQKQNYPLSRVGIYYVFHHSSSADKARVLNVIGERLNIKVKVEME